MNYQGLLTDSSGDRLGVSGSGTSYYFKFSIYDAATGGTKKWPSGSPQETEATVRDGIFSVNIGEDTAETLDLDFQTDTSLYLQVEVSETSGGSFEELTPRQRIVAAGYAINADTVDGYHATTTGASGTIPILGTSGSLSLDGGLTLSSSSPATTTNSLYNQGGALYFNGSAIGASVTADSLDFDDFENTLDIDEATEINFGANALTFDLDGAGDFIIQDGGSSFATFADDGTITFTGASTFATTSISALTVSGSISLPANSITLATDTTGNYVATIATSTGGLTLSGSGSENANVTIGLASSGATAGTYGSGSASAVITVDSFGRITSISTSSITGGSSSNSFETISTPLGTSPVADSSTDTLTFSTSSNILTITGSSSADSITFGISSNSITATELATDSVTSDEIAANAVGASELASTAVTAGSYGSSSQTLVLTIDTDGRITSAASTSILITESQITDLGSYQTENDILTDLAGLT
ncbi:MAG: hypothetical protein Q8Q32_02330, partial [bacterium]|nr:hypothetical protein [bacterium]